MPWPWRWRPRKPPRAMKRASASRACWRACGASWARAGGPRPGRHSLLLRHAWTWSCPSRRGLWSTRCRATGTAKAPPVFYVENALINSLFGLLCWPAVFMALPGAFFHPFQSGPADLGTPDFTLRRAAAFDACLARLDDGSYRALDAAQDSHVHLAPLPFPVPVYGLAVEPKRHGDEQRAWEILGKLAAEDPCLRIEHVAATNETVLYGLGELHLRIVLERLREVYRFEVQTRPPRIAYRETVTAPAEGHYRHKKQSGGAGQFAEVFLRIEPLARGAGFDFADDIRGGAIPGQFIPAVEKGVREVLAYGAIAGYPVVDVRVVVYDGKHHMLAPE